MLESITYEHNKLNLTKYIKNKRGKRAISYSDLIKIVGNKIVYIYILLRYVIDTNFLYCMKSLEKKVR